MEDETGIVAVFAANVRRARLAADLSQEQLAFDAGVDRTYISQVERQKRNPTIIILARIASALKMPPGDLLASSGVPTPRRGKRLDGR